MDNDEDAGNEDEMQMDSDEEVKVMSLEKKMASATKVIQVLAYLRMLSFLCSFLEIKQKPMLTAASRKSKGANPIGKKTYGLEKRPSATKTQKAGASVAVSRKTNQQVASKKPTSKSVTRGSATASAVSVCH